jgi:hypothetical protein
LLTALEQRPRSQREVIAMPERERTSRAPVSSRAPVEIGLDVDWEAASPRSYPPPSIRERASPTRSGTLRWADFERALEGRPPSPSPVRGGTLKWEELARARADALGSSRKSPVRGGTLKWGDMLAQLPPVLGPPPAEARPSAREDRTPERDLLDDLPVETILAPLLSAGLVRRSGRDLARRRGVDDRRDPSEPPARVEKAGSPRDLASAIQGALDDEEG